MSASFFGLLCGIVSAICYGTNPLGALKLYAEGMPTSSVLFYRFSLAWIIIALLMTVRGLASKASWHETLLVTRKEFKTLTVLGLLFTASSLTLYLSFHLMDAGVASTILFTYPVMTAIIMAVCFKEHLQWSTLFAILLASVGVVLLYWGDGSGTLPANGVLLVLTSALTYAIYIIVASRSNLQMSSFKINFYVLLYCAVGMLTYSFFAHETLMLPPNAASWFFVGWLAIVPAIMALVLMVYAAKLVGSTTTAILGALEPLTAVIIGIIVFHEQFTASLAVGIALILSAVVLIVLHRSKHSS